MIDYVYLGKRIRACRKKLKLTQEQMAEKLDLSTSFYGHIERGTRIMSMDTFIRICMVLDATADELLGLFGAHPRRHVPEEWFAERVAKVIAVLEDANLIANAMKSPKNPCQTGMNPL